MITRYTGICLLVLMGTPEELLPLSRDWAQSFYNLRGACFPHSAYPVPISVMPYPSPDWGWEIFETPWTVQSLWWHYTYTGDKELLRNLLANTPLNLPRVFVYALYFIFMPAAILGPVLGVIGTALLAGVAAYLWLWGEPGSMDAFLWFWLIWAVVDWVLLILFRLQLICRCNVYKCIFKPILPIQRRNIRLLCQWCNFNNIIIALRCWCR